tara:strand:+ start:1574 stop:2560 length:987 start_codon:yes stop_codon:yes gene_type:complete
MDNTIIPYNDNSDVSSEELDDSDENDEYSHILSNNIGIHYNKFVTSGDFMNMENQRDYESIRNKYFTPEIRKIRLLVESKNITYSSDRNTSNYKIHFENNNTNSTGGYGNFDNVIGFRLIKANIFNSIYTVNDNNRNLIVKLSTGSDVSVNLTQGSYTFQELGDHLISILNSHVSLSGFSIIKNTTTFKYKIENSTSFRIKWSSSSGYAYRLFGFNNEDNNSDNTSYTSDNVVQQSTQFVDLVIPEIPYIACKRNSIGKHLIDRIPLDCEQGSIMYYSSDINLENYFTPININSLNIQLYEDTTDTLYDCQNNDNSFEFELTILNKHV